MTAKQKTILIMLWTITCLLFVGNIASADELVAKFDGKCVTVTWSSSIDDLNDPYLISIAGYDKEKMWLVDEIFLKRDLHETRRICYSYEMDPDTAHITVTIYKLGEVIATTTIN